MSILPVLFRIIIPLPQFLVFTCVGQAKQKFGHVLLLLLFFRQPPSK